MSRIIFRACRFSALIGFAFAFLGLCALPALAQTGSHGAVTVLVTDPSGAIVPNTNLELVDLATNQMQKGATTSAGTYSFIGLPIGTYRLKVTKGGFESQVFGNISVQAGRTTDVSVHLRVGTTTQQVVVSAAVTPLLQTTTSSIATTINMKQIQDLPLGGRDISSLAFLTPGYAMSPANNGGYGTDTWNGLPVIAQGNNINGVISSSSRMKFDGNAQPGVSARLEDMQEMTVDTGQLNVSEGFGQAAMQTTFVTKHGTNAYHGQVYEDFRNSYLNANSWFNDAVGLPKNHLILNDFGGAVGGPILKNKLFFFGSFAMSKQPGGYTASQTFLSPLAQQGILTESNGTQVNLFSQVAQPNGLPTTINSQISSALQKINTAVQSGVISRTSDPNTEQVSWLVPSPATTYFPAVRLDYTVSPSLRLDVNWTETKYNQPGVDAPSFPGAAFTGSGGGNSSNNYTAGIGLDWTISPTLINQFRGGYYYNATWYAQGVQPTYTTLPRIFFGSGMGNSGQTFPNLPVTTYYPIFNFSDNMTWQHGAHTLSFGMSWWREQDHYWNPPDGILSYSLGLVSGDPAFNAFESYFANVPSADRADAENLYATLIGRISSVNPGGGSGFPLDLKTGQFYKTVGEYPLDELMKSWGLFIHDSWRYRPSLTFNYGLRWDFTGDNHDLTGAYHSPTSAGIFGPSGPGNLFNPGVYTTDQAGLNPQYVARVHVYQPWNVSPQPEFGIAWNPRYSSGLLGKLTGHGNTVIRAGYMLRRFTEPQQYYWDAASNYGFAYYQYFSLSAAAPESNGQQATGTFAPGSLTLGNSLPPFFYSLPQYEATVPEASQTWFGNGLSGIPNNIRQPYVQQWNLGVERQFGHNNLISVRYIGSHTVHEWILEDPNEVNIFQPTMNIGGAQVPGFLSEFKAAQSNLAINAANGQPGTFADLGFTGEQALPIFNAAFAGEAADSNGVPVDYDSGQFINYLNQGAAGSFAGSLDTIFGTAPYFCNLVGSSFSPCVNQIGYTGSGAGFPINYFQANPYMSGNQILYMTDAGFGNYNGLQIDFRQNEWHGMMFDANYTWSHALGIEPNGQWQGYPNLTTLRNSRLSYGPNPYDIRQVLHVSGTYDLPFGRGRAFLSNANGFLNRVVGGWNVGTIITYQTGSPSLLVGGYNTFNINDGGVLLNGVSTSQLQSAVGVYTVPGGAPYKYGINPQYLTSSGFANPQYFAPNSTPGTFGQHPWIYGPHFFNTDIALTKSTPIRENINFVFQAEFLNAFNHPNWGIQNYAAYYYINDNVQGPGFLQDNVINENSGFGREIELRANIQF